MKFLIFGGNGFLGSYLKKFLRKKFFVNTVTRIKNNGIYLKNYKLQNVSKIISRTAPDVIINTIALTDVDKCEYKKKLAYESNVKIVKTIMEAARKIKKKNKVPFLIHLSSDQVYSDKGPHKEANYKSVNYYSKTKLLSERYIDTKFGLLFLKLSLISLILSLFQISSSVCSCIFPIGRFLPKVVQHGVTVPSE